MIRIVEDDGNLFAFDRMGILPMIRVGNTLEKECLAWTVKPPVGKER